MLDIFFQVTCQACDQHGDYVSHVMRKPVLCLCEQQGTDQPAHSQSLISTFIVCCLDSIIPLVSFIRNFKTLTSFCGCAGRFVSYLVANPEDRFSCDKAHVAYLRFCLKTRTACTSMNSSKSTWIQGLAHGLADTNDSVTEI